MDTQQDRDPFTVRIFARIRVAHGNPPETVRWTLVRRLESSCAAVARFAARPSRSCPRRGCDAALHQGGSHAHRVSSRWHGEADPAGLSRRSDPIRIHIRGPLTWQGFKKTTNLV